METVRATLRPVRALTWANGRSAASSGPAAGACAVVAALLAAVNIVQIRHKSRWQRSARPLWEPGVLPPRAGPTRCSATWTGQALRRGLRAVAFFEAVFFVAVFFTAASSPSWTRSASSAARGHRSPRTRAPGDRPGSSTPSARARHPISSSETSSGGGSSSAGSRISSGQYVGCSALCAAGPDRLPTSHVRGHGDSACAVRARAGVTCSGGGNQLVVAGVRL